MDHSPHPHDSHTGSSFWHLVSMFLGVVFGLAALILAAGFLYGGIRGTGEVTSSTAAGAGVSTPGPSASGTPSMENGTAFITLHPGAINPMTYDTPTFTVKSGDKVKITFINDSPVPMQHNLCICKPGSKDAMIVEAMKMITDPNGMAKGYIPDTPNILWHTPLVNPKESKTLEFTAPAPGDYPYLCTFPGHTALMNGTMKVQ